MPSLPARPSSRRPAPSNANPPTDVWFALPRGSLILDWAGPAEAFRIANQEAVSAQGAPAFRMHFVAPHGASLASVGVELAGLQPLPAAVDAPAWVVVVGKTLTGQRRADDAEDRAVTAWLARIQPGVRDGVRLVTVCSGALLAAAAGLLRGRRVTTHHLDIEWLQEQERGVENGAVVVPDRVFVRDGEVWSSAGVTAGIDLALHLISDRCGAVVAARVAQRMAVALRRGPDDPQLSPFLAHRRHLNARLHGVQDAISRAPGEAWTAERMAAEARTTTRTLNRLFALHAGTTPQAYLRGLRLALARSALESGSSVARAAEAAGFSSDLQLRRAWRSTGSPGAPSGRAARHA
jgi:transcriptional regulator GlxA family with amidase domain